MSGDNFDVENVNRESGLDTVILTLYVAGQTPHSIKAIQTIRSLCETYLTGRYELEVVDIYQQPQLLKQEQIMATPTLIKRLPLPLRKLVGDLSDENKVLIAFELKERG